MLRGTIQKLPSIMKQAITRRRPITQMPRMDTLRMRESMESMPAVLTLKNTASSDQASFNSSFAQLAIELGIIFVLSFRACRRTKKRTGLHLVGQATAHPAAFAIVVAYAILWIGFDSRTFDFNAVATLIVWLMTLFIQRANRRDTLALHAKLDELLRVDHRARSELTRLDEQEPEMIAKHRDAEVIQLRQDDR
jgi:low affinity Fe/Cu permease